MAKSEWIINIIKEKWDPETRELKNTKTAVKGKYGTAMHQAQRASSTGHPTNSRGHFSQKLKLVDD